MKSSNSYKIVFLSNYYNYHQSELSEALFRETGGNYCFIETEPMEIERKQMGWDNIKLPSFVKQSYNSESSKEECLSICYHAEIVIIGSAPEYFITERLKENRLTFRYHERYFKKGRWSILDPRVLISHYRTDYIYRNKNLYMLCASAYTAQDCKFIHCYKNKTFKWGYFPKVKKYDNLDLLIENKNNNSITWVGRFIDWKHPEIPVKIAKRLVVDGYLFELNMIGSGVMMEKIKKMIFEEGLEGRVRLLGSMPPEKVREYMEKSEIFMFTSDRQEGWGAVLNESMNSGCAVVANRAIGSVPYLLKEGENGLIYGDGNLNDLYQKVKYLLNNSEKRKQFGKNAYKTLTDIWNAEVAATRLLELIDNIKSGKDSPYLDGPCSKA